jgi:hypothetical protein
LGHLLFRKSPFRQGGGDSGEHPQVEELRTGKSHRRLDTTGSTAYYPSMAEFVGKVTSGPFGKGSKSEHTAVYLETAQGRFVLRREQGNPFNDPVLQAMVGKTVRCEGELEDYVLLASECKVLDE